MQDNIVTVNVNRNLNVNEEKIVRFSLPLEESLDIKIKSKAKMFGLTKTGYIRMLLIQDVEK